MEPEQKTSVPAKILYRPVGIVSGMVAGALAGQLFKQVWKRVAADEDADTPKALESEYPMKQVVLAAVIQGAIFAGVKAAVDRGGARAFQRWTGEWPGN